MTEAQRAAIQAHGEKLHAIFPATRDLAALDLCRKLRRIETEAGRLAERYCNGEMNEPAYLAEDGRLEGNLDRLLDFTGAGVPVFLNGDPRGYALKIDDAYMREHGIDLHRDWGGYGIIAPEIDQDGR